MHYFCGPVSREQSACEDLCEVGWVTDREGLNVPELLCLDE